MEESRRTFSLAGLYEVVQVWQGRIASAPAVDAFVASGYDDSESAGGRAQLGHPCRMGGGRPVRSWGACGSRPGSDR
ncbi:DUF6247 family protein (plasmid) [Streptomyces mirabilis]|nr:DUF6247 family protein [Streptomyces mirabilis]